MLKYVFFVIRPRAFAYFYWVILKVARPGTLFIRTPIHGVVFKFLKYIHNKDEKKIVPSN